MNKYFLFLLLLALWACNLEKPLDLAIDAPPNQLEIQAFLSPNDGIAAYVGAVVPPYGDLSAPSLSNVEVSVFRNGEFWTTLEETTPKHWQLPSHESVSAEATYHLEVSAEDYPTLITDAISMLPVVELDTVFYFDDIDTTAPGVYFQFQDPKGIANYYYWAEAVWSKGEVNHGPEPGTFRPSMIHEDVKWDGETFAGREFFYTIEPDSVAFAFYHISPVIYDYFDAVYQMGIDGTNAFTMPPVMPSNVSGGAGFFGAVNYQHMTVKRF